jgi:hypothetical protein
MAIKWPDGWGLYMMNGIKMKPEYITTPATEISVDTVLAERNVDQRRELIRKVGVSRMVHAGKVVEESNGYKLVDMAPVFTGIPYAPHLLMKNPSVPDTYHLEGVAPECKTVQQAINWRGGDISIHWEPESLN